MNTHKLQYKLVDVFTDRAFGGNQLAVVTDGSGLHTATMQAIAKEFNLSETTFVLPPEDMSNSFKVRIFTPAYEMPMAGHPTVGTGFVLALIGRIKQEAGKTEAQARFEENIGVIPVRVTFNEAGPDAVWMTQPLPRWGETLEDREEAASIISLHAGDLDPNLPVQIVSTGVPFLYIPVRDLQAAHAAALNMEAWRRVAGSTEATGVFLFTREVETAGSTVHSRMFAPDLGVFEDPATGAASGPLGCYLVKYGVAKPEGNTARILSEQGLEMGRPSFVHIEIDGTPDNITGVRIGGTCVYMGGGELEIQA